MQHCCLYCLVCALYSLVKYLLGFSVTQLWICCVLPLHPQKSREKINSSSWLVIRTGVVAYQLLSRAEQAQHREVNVISYVISSR